MTTNVQPQEGYAALLTVSDFGLLMDEEAFLAIFGAGTEGPKHLDSQMTQFDVIESLMVDKDGFLTMLHLLVFTAKANNKDTPNYGQAINGPDALGYTEAMEKEIQQLEEKHLWDIIPINDIPEGANILDSSWAFKHKRFPDGRVGKLKARLCVQGDQQIEGVDFFDTYAPVVAWSTVQLLLILLVILALETKQVNNTLAFIHADLKDDVYVWMVRGFEQKDHLYKLKKNLYGLRQSPLNFFLSLKYGLEARGFKQSKYDPCLFVSDQVIC
jgi:hypothetical protein